MVRVIRLPGRFIVQALPGAIAEVVLDQIAWPRVGGATKGLPGSKLSGDDPIESRLVSSCMVGTR